MWTETTRRKHARKGLRYSSDLTDEEGAVLEPLLPRRSRVGRPAKWPLRTIANAMLYILRSGQPWRMLPGDFPPMTTVQRYFYAWRDRRLWSTINHLLLMECRDAAGRMIPDLNGESDFAEDLRRPRGAEGRHPKGVERHLATLPGPLHAQRSGPRR